MTDRQKRKGADRAGASGRMKLLGHITCPHCWHRFPVEDLVWVARHDELQGDPILGERFFIRFRPSRFNVSGEALDAHGLACHEIGCPTCHLSIPRVFLETEALFFSIIGGPASGKSNLLAAMTWELRRLLPRTFDLALNDADPGSNLILKGYEDTLFLPEDREKLVALDKTRLTDEVYDEILQDDQVVRLPRPFLFTLRPTGGHPNSHQAAAHSRLLCLYDNAGEHFLPGQDTTLAPGTRHMARSRMLMFLYDPTQMPRFRDRCLSLSEDPQLSAKVSTYQQATILTEAGLRVRQYAGISPNERWDKPLLVLVSKADIWSGLIDEDLTTDPYFDADSSTGELATVDVARVKRVSKRVRELLMELTPEFVGAAEDFCSHVMYVPVSALGHSPESMPDKPDALGIRPKDLHPRWVTVPLVYAFARWSTGLVAGT